MSSIIVSFKTAPTVMLCERVLGITVHCPSVSYIPSDISCSSFNLGQITLAFIGQNCRRIEFHRIRKGNEAPVALWYGSLKLYAEVRSIEARCDFCFPLSRAIFFSTQIIQCKWQLRLPFDCGTQHETIRRIFKF